MRWPAENPLEGTFGDSLENTPLNWAVRMFGILCVVGAILYAVWLAGDAFATVEAFRAGKLTPDGMSTIVVTFIHLADLAALTAAFIVLGVRLLTSKRRYAAQTTSVIIALLVLNAACCIMLFGIDHRLGIAIGASALAIAFRTYIDPDLIRERRCQRKARELEERDEQRAGTLGRDETGKGYIALNFFNLFWIFVVCSVLGLALETTFHALQFHAYQDRAGMLFGPFSPIYGVGALLMTLCLNRFYRANPLVIFLVSAIIGGAFEYFTSWFMQIAFGAVAWNYTGMWLSIGGRTCGLFMCFWGLLGMVWIKLLLPLTLRAVNLIPWNWRYWLTAVCAALMLVNAVMTLQALDCWYERLSGAKVMSPIQQFYAQHFDNAYMADRFQSMTIHPEDAARGK